MDHPSELQTAVRSHVEDLAQSVGADRVFMLVAVSGGVDSMALLHAAWSCAKDRPEWDVAAVHVNHHLRESADKDAEFVQTICTAWNIPLTVRDVDVAEAANKDHRGFEAAARELRYHAIASVAEHQNATCVLLAHHGDDQVETVLWRLLRGTSLSGLSGMRNTSHRLGVHWIRPFLQTDKMSLSTYLATQNIPHVEDETNQSDAYTRNYLRRHVIPELLHLQPKLHQLVGKTCEILQAEDDYMDEQAKRVINQAVERREFGFDIHLTPFRTAARPLQRRAIQILLYCFPSTDWTSSHIDGVVALAYAENPSVEMDLSKDIRARRVYEHLFLGELPLVVSDDYCIRWQPEDEHRLQVPVPDGQWEFQCEVRTQKTEHSQNHWMELWMPCVDCITVRSPQLGERVRVLGLKGTKKVQDIFVDAKVPRIQRATWPLLEVNGEVVWVPGLARSEHCLVSDWNRPTYLISARRIPVSEPVISHHPT